MGSENGLKDTSDCDDKHFCKHRHKSLKSRPSSSQHAGYYSSSKSAAYSIDNDAHKSVPIVDDKANVLSESET